MPKGIKGFPKGYTPHNKGLKGYTNNGTFKDGIPPVPHKENCNCFRCNPQKGENNYWWKGDRVKYSGIHMRKRAIDKPAKNYECSMKDETCKGQMCWASISHKALRNINDYFPLCNSHNQRYDYEFRRTLLKNKNK